ncbi:MAG: glycosyltransferase family 2 protein [Elusimicrobia bacterium]|nr:glycosyltransferase family 2 protein [Elusimicrobiota bacterium]
MTAEKPVLSVVAPVHNEEGSLPEFHARLMRALGKLGVPFEVLYVDDGSRDRSPELLRRFHEENPAVKVLHFSRNFGHQVAITAGMDHALGAACVVMDSDGQDPPEVIEDLVAQWKKGSEVVYAVRIRREEETLFKRATAALFYRILKRITRVDMPVDAGDFRLIDRQVLAVLGRMRESHRFMRGLASWVGFRQAKVEYVRQARLAGKSHYPLWKMARFAVDAITSFSHEPLHWVTACGAGSFFASMLIGFWVLYVRLFNPRAVPGWTSLMVLVLFLGGIQLISLGVIGEYLGRVFDEVKRRPLYIVRKSLGYPPKEP